VSKLQADQREPEGNEVICPDCRGGRTEAMVDGRSPCFTCHGKGTVDCGVVEARMVRAAWGDHAA
jgi:DnaJ-class molecular chaperone